MFPKRNFPTLIPAAVCYQIMTQYASITSIEFPPVFQTFLSAISVINLDFGWLFSSVCIVDVREDCPFDLAFDVPLHLALGLACVSALALDVALDLQ